MEISEGQGYSFRDLFVILGRRQIVVYGTVLVLGVLTVVYCAFCTRRYEAACIVQLQKENADAMGLESLMSGATAGASDVLGVNIDLQTQANILESDTLALKTIETLQLEKTDDFRPRWNPIGAVFELFAAHGAKDAPGAALENSPRRRKKALEVFAKNLQVRPITGTRLIEMHYMNPDPKLAAAVVNTLAQALVDYTFQTRYNATNQTSKWLNDQLADLRKNSEDLQSKVVELERQSGVYGLDAGGSGDGKSGQGSSQAYSGVIDRLQQKTMELSLAEQNRILKGAIAHAAATGNAEMLSGLAGNLGPSTQSMNNSLALLQNLREQEAAAQGALDQARAKYGPAYSRVAELHGQLKAIQRSIEDEVQRIRGRAETDYQIAVQVENGIRLKYKAAKEEADKLNDKAIEYAIVHQDALESRKLYADLMKRLKEAGVLESLKSSNITVVDPGRPPADPKRPAVPLYMAIALIGGLVLGCCAAFVIDGLDNKVNNVTDLEGVTDQDTLGALPFVRELQDNKSPMMLVEAPRSPYSEAVRAVRTGLLLSRGDEPPKVVLISSSVSGEGKTTFSINLSMAFAQHGYRVLLVDADLRRGSSAKRLGFSSSKTGLSTLLSGLSKEDVVCPYPEVANLFLVPSGPVPPNPAELLGSSNLRKYLGQWRKDYDFVLFDGAPVLPVTDSVSLNELVDATLLLARAELVEKAQVKRSYKLLSKGGKHFVGFVLNGLSGKDRSYYGYFSYYGYRSEKVYPYAYKKENDNA